MVGLGQKGEKSERTHGQGQEYGDCEGRGVGGGGRRYGGVGITGDENNEIKS